MRLFKRSFFQPSRAKSDTDLASYHFENEVTPKDVFYAYRLFLQREPDAAGWHAWTKQIPKLSLMELVRGFLFSGEHRRKFSSNSRPTRVELDGFSIYVRKSDWLIGAAIAQHKVYEPHVTRSLSLMLKPGMVFLDIGANLGFFSLLAASKVGETGKVIAFEPNYDNCALIHLSLYANRFRQVMLYPYAVSDQEQMLLVETSGSSNGDTVPLDTADDLSDMLVQAVCVDDILSNEPRIDVIKIDIEGNEMRALLGMRQVIQKHRPIIFTEFFPSLLQKASGVSAETYLKELRLFEYEIFVIHADGNTSNSPQTDVQIMQIWQSLPEPSTKHLDLLLKPIG